MDQQLILQKLEFIAPALGQLLGQNIDEIIRARGSVTTVALVGLVWELAKKAFLFFISTYLSVSNLVYGSVAAIIAFLAWAYLNGLIFLFGAYLSPPTASRGSSNKHRQIPIPAFLSDPIIRPILISPNWCI
jgi:hypothetical protein